MRNKIVSGSTPVSVLDSVPDSEASVESSADVSDSAVLELVVVAVEVVEPSSSEPDDVSDVSIGAIGITHAARTKAGARRARSIPWRSPSAGLSIAILVTTSNRPGRPEWMPGDAPAH